jgi:hypothetical protein
MLPNDSFRECEQIIEDFFDGDLNKSELWWTTQNPLLGNIRPVDFAAMKGFDRLLKIIKQWRNGEMP